MTFLLHKCIMKTLNVVVNYISINQAQITLVIAQTLLHYYNYVDINLSDFVQM